MSALSGFLRNKLIDHCFRGQTFPAPQVLYIGLFVEDPNSAGTMQEVSAADYQRIPIMGKLDPPINGITRNSDVIVFSAGTLFPWGTVRSAAIWDTPDGGTGNMLIGAPLEQIRTIAQGDPVRYDVGELVISFA